MPADPKNPGQRTKAHRLRKAIAHGQTLNPIDALWLSDYEQQDAKRKQKNGAPPSDVGASRKSRTIDLTIDEQAESVGTGSAAEAAAIGALREREEGRRLDALTMHSTEAIKEACAVYKDITLMLAENFEKLMGAVVQSMTDSRTHYLAAAQMEAALIQAQQQQSGNPADEMIMLVLAKQLGIDPALLKGGIAVAQAQAQQQQQGANGVSK